MLVSRRFPTVRGSLTDAALVQLVEMGRTMFLAWALSSTVDSKAGWRTSTASWRGTISVIRFARIFARGHGRSTTCTRAWRSEFRSRPRLYPN